MWNTYENLAGTGGGVCNIYGISDYFQTSLGSWAIKKQGRSIRLIKDDSDDPGFVVDYDGNIYPTCKIGSQVWMAQNLIVTHYNNGDEIPYVLNPADWIALATGAQCIYNNNYAYL